MVVVSMSLWVCFWDVFGLAVTKPRPRLLLLCSVVRGLDFVVGVVGVVCVVDRS
jgi:hypothetical protein